MKITREVKTAILVISGIVLFIYLFNYLRGKNLFDSAITYQTEFEYNGLTESSPVTIKGNPVGKITKIDYDFDTGKTKVIFSVDEQLKFSKNSKVRLYEEGLMGGNALAIIEAEDEIMAIKGDMIASEVQQGLVKNLTNDFSGLSSGLDKSLKSADTLLINLNKIVEDDSEKGLKSVIAELNTTLKSFKMLSVSLNTLVSKNDSNIEKVLANLNKVSQDFTIISSDLKQANLGQTVKGLDTTLSSVNDLISKIGNEEGTVGKLLSDKELYNNLEGATKELEELLKDIKLHPKRYFRVLSKKEIPYEEN